MGRSTWSRTQFLSVFFARASKPFLLIHVAFRFPYLCFKNGGGAYLIPYFLLIITGSVPMYYLEIIMGQYTRSGAIKIWDICPMFRGVGIGIIILNMFVNVYFIILMVWPMHFMFASLYAWFAPFFGDRKYFIP